MPGVNTCNQCGSWLCEACTVDIQGRLFCRTCLAELAAHGERTPVSAHTTAAPSKPVKRRISRFLLLLFSFPPGVNYMYLGLIKRGLAVLCGFFLLVYLINTTFVWQMSMVIGMSIFVLWVTCFFDSFSIRRRILAGEDVNDGIDVLQRNKHLIIGGLVLFAVVSMAGNIVGVLARFISGGIPILLVCLGLYVLFGRSSRKKDKDNTPD